MRFIHTADWHLGNSMHDIDRQEETKQFLAWLKDRIVRFGAQCLVISGDIFDTAVPPLEARRMYFQFLASLLDTDCKNVVIIGGNHDSGALLDAPRDLLEALNIQMVGSLGERSVEELVKELTDVNGNVVGISAAVPYVREPELRRFKPESGDADFAQSTYSGLYSAVYEAAESLRAGRDIPIVATGHLYASKLEGRPENDEGKDAKGHGMRDIVGNLGTIPVSVFPEGFDYVALGHIHYTTMVAQNPKVRYSGSPFVLGFDEAKIPHHILEIDLEKGEEPVVMKIESPQYFKFVRVSGSIENIIMQLNHEGRVYARGGNKTLTVGPDEIGLKMAAYLGGTEEGRKIFEEIKGGYLTKMSHGFRRKRSKREVIENLDEHRIDIHVEILEVAKEYDVSVVSLPANDATEISARNFCEGVIAEVKEERLAIEAQRRKKEQIAIMADMI